jgi:hypothetical protein
VGPRKPRAKQRRRQTGKDIKVLCYEHHIEMSLSRIFLKIGRKSRQTAAYVCEEPGCSVRYNGSRGYFIITQDRTQIEREIVPRVSCPQDGHLMYLAEIRPAQKNYRLWKCPECEMHRTNEDFSRASGA